MSLAALIKAETTTSTGHECKTCMVLARLTDQDRADFTEAVTARTQGTVLARALNGRLEEIGSDLTIGPESVRAHIARRHTA